MKVQEVKAEIHKGLGEFLLEKGFKFSRSRFEYVQNQKELVHMFRIQVHAKTEWFHVKPEVFVACPRVIKISNEAFAENYRATEVVMGFGIRDKYESRGSYGIDGIQDIAGVLDKIRADFVEVAEPFFSKIQSLKDMEKHMNQKCETGLYRPLSVSFACYGLIAAKLCGNQEFDVICRDYYEFCKRSQGKLAEPILQMKEYLQPLQARVTPIALLGPKVGE